MIGALARLAVWTAAALLIAGVVHIVSILAMPALAPDDAWRRLSALGEEGKATTLPRPEPGREIVPFSDPAGAAAVCRYDLARGPMRLRLAAPGDATLTLSFRTEAGALFYAMTDRAALRGQIDVLVATAEQMESLEAAESDEEAPQELRLVAPARRGFAFLRAIPPYPSQLPAAEAALAATQCAAESDR